MNWKNILNESRKKEMKFYLYLFKKNPLAIFGIIIISFFIIIAILEQYISPYHFAKTFIGPRLQPPSSKFLFGTDELGRDVLSRTIYGTRVSLRSGFIVVMISMIIGVPIGLISGFFGSWIDELCMRITDIFLSIPSIILSIMIVIILGPGLEKAIIAVAFTRWTRYARLMRGQTLSIKESLFIEAAKSYSASNMRIIFKHILPNAISPLLVQVSAGMGGGILMTAALSFLGIGAQPPIPEWGLMVSSGRSYLPSSWWYSTLPGFAIVLVVLGFNLLGDGLRDIFDPKLRE